MESVGATQHQVTYKLIHRGQSDTWEDSVSPLRAIACRAENTNVLNLMGGYAAALRLVYLLVAVNGSIELVYGLQHCYEVPGGGARVLGLMGEQEKHGEVVIELVLYTLEGAVAAQAAHFGRMTVLALALADIEAAYAANEALELVAPDGAANAADVVTWKALVEVPAKRAWVFAGGRTFREAVTWIPRILGRDPGGIQK